MKKVDFFKTDISKNCFLVLDITPKRLLFSHYEGKIYWCAAPYRRREINQYTLLRMKKAINGAYVFSFLKEIKL